MKSLSKSFLSKLFVAFTVLLLTITISSQKATAQGFASVVGTVTDPSAAVVSGATVTATQDATGRKTTVTTNEQGAFVFPSLPPANYSIAVVAAGFQTTERKGILLEADQSLTVNLQVKVGATAETVEVSSAPPTVDTTTGTLSQVIDQERVVDLPLNGRNAASLVTLVAGVVDATNEGNGVNQGNGKTFPAAVVTSVNGTLPNQSNYLLDGGNNVDEMTNVNDPFPFPDALQEFSVQTSNYNAEFGQSAGAVVNIVTKSGTRKFHGDAFEFLRNGYFDAKPYFATVADNLHRNQFGGTIGGPVIIPHFSTGARTQFFFGYQHTLLHQNSNSTLATVPTLAEEGLTPAGTQLGYADFGAYCASGFNAASLCNTASQQITNPFTNVAYPLNRIPSTDFDPAAVNYEKVFPTCSAATHCTETAGQGGTVNYYKPTVQSYNEYLGRLDHTFGDNDHLFGHYYYDYFIQAADYNPANLLSYQSYFNTRYQNALISETHSFSASLLNNLILNYQREVSLRGGPPGSQDITAFGVNNFWQPNTGPYLAASISGYFGASSAGFAGWGRNNYTFNDDLHWVKGRHSFAFGGHYELSKFDVTNVNTSYGSFAFAPVNNVIAGKTYAYQDAFANFQLGFMSALTQGGFEQVNDRNHFPGVYAQDSWKATQRLTLNYGVRWEEFAPWTDKVGQLQVFSSSAYTSNVHTNSFSTLPAGLLLSGDPSIVSNGVRNQYMQFMPRVGFAFDVFGNGKSAVRGGFGMFYQDRLPGFFNLNQAANVPNTISVGLTDPGMAGASAGVNPGGPFSNPYCTGCAVGSYPNPFPFTLPFASNKVFPNGILVDEYDPSGNFRVPVTDSFNLTVEQQLASSWSMRVAYVGSLSRHQFVNLELNPSVNNGSGLSTNSRRVYNTAPNVAPCTVAAGCAANYAQIVEASMSGNAHFNSLQATLQKRLTHGLSLLLNYTWSKSYDDLPQATRVSNTENLNAGESYVYPLYPSNATGIPAAAMVPDIKALDRGVSDIDHPNALSFSYVYMLPKVGHGNRAISSVVNGWRISGLIQHHSGDALTTYTGSDTSLTGLTQDRAQRDFTKPAYFRQGGTGKCVAGKSCVNWLNSAAFSVPVNAGAGTGFGNVVKGSLRGPGFTNWDAAVIRAFPIYRETNLEFRAEYFDVLNHTELSNPAVSNPSSATYGTITGTQGGPRIGQFSLKYIF